MDCPERSFIMTAQYAARRWVCAVVVVVVMITGVGCSSVDLNYPREPSYAVTDYRSTSLGKHFLESEEQQPEQSGFALLRRGDRAFTARIALAELAEKSLDLQYYIWEPDLSGHLLMLAVVRAADRGVRVRVLLDDHAVQKRDEQIAALSGHPNISVRAYNAFRNRNRIFDYATDFARVNTRMHNKVFAADNAMAVIGGRNIADEYFGLSQASNYRDLDVACSGPIVREISEGFDVFWNSAYSLPYAAFVQTPPTESDARRAVEEARNKHAGMQLPFDLESAVGNRLAPIDEIAAEFTWARAQLFRDDPDKLITRSRGVIEPLRRAINEADHELLVEAAYFVPGQPAIDFLRDLTGRGVRVRMLTNSFASNDVRLVYVHYAKRRCDVLRAGVELHEQRPDAVSAGEYRRSDSDSGLHAKSLVIDRQRAFIGSFNLDPRSANINTEIGVLIDSPVIAGELAEFMDEGAQPANSYRLALDECGDLIWWVADSNGKLKPQRDEPFINGCDRFGICWMGLLPVRAQL